MKTISTVLAVLLTMSASWAADTSPATPDTKAESRTDDAYAAGQRAVAAQNWKLAIEQFRKAAQADANNADAHNMLGYSLRSDGQYDAAFAAYNRALALNPQHKGALHYSGIAYLKTNKPAAAQANLAKLQAICATCSETQDLSKAIAGQPSAVRY